MTQSLPDWIASHQRAFACFGGVPAQVVPDNLKSGGTKACFHDPEINRTYADLGGRITTRPWCRRGLTSPKSEPLCAIGSRTMANAKVEAAVQLAERWIVVSKTRLRHDARLRNRQFFCTIEVNAAIQPLLAALNDKVLRHLGASRRVLFEQLDKPALKPLPVEPDVHAEWQQCHGRARLPCRHRQALLLAPPSADEESARGRVLPTARWRCSTTMGAWPRQVRTCQQSAALHAARSHADAPQVPRRLDA